MEYFVSIHLRERVSVRDPRGERNDATAEEAGPAGVDRDRADHHMRITRTQRGGQGPGQVQDDERVPSPGTPSNLNRARIPRRNLKLVDRAATYAHNDSNAGAPKVNAFLKRLIPFLNKISVGNGSGKKKGSGKKR